MRALSLIALAGCVTGLRATAPTSQTAQPFALPSSDGRTIALAESLPAVLVFYRGHW